MVQPGFFLGYVFQGADQLRHPEFFLGSIFHGYRSVEASRVFPRFCISRCRSGIKGFP